MIFCLWLVLFYSYPQLFNTENTKQFSQSNFPPFKDENSENPQPTAPGDGLSTGNLAELKYAFDALAEDEYADHLVLTSTENLSGELPLRVSQGREYKILDERLQPDEDTLQPINNRYSQSFYEDKNNYYLETYLLEMALNDKTPLAYYPAIRKSQYPNLQFLGFMGEQSADIPLWYSNGCLLAPPYAFPVDKNSFSFAAERVWDSSLPESWPQRDEYIRTHGRRFFRNWGKQYRNYIGEDKDWVYRWSNPDDNYHYALLREKKQSDFKLLSFAEIKTYETTGQPRDLKIYKGKIDTQNRKLLLEDTFWNPELAYYDNHIYALSSFWTAIFPIDGASMYRDIKKVRERWKDYDTSYGLLMDKDYYYQMLYHSDGGYYTLNRIKK